MKSMKSRTSWKVGKVEDFFTNKHIFTAEHVVTKNMFLPTISFHHKTMFQKKSQKKTFFLT